MGVCVWGGGGGCRHRRQHTLGLRSITLEGMHQFNLNFTAGSSIIKYRSSSIRGGNQQNFD